MNQKSTFPSTEAKKYIDSTRFGIIEDKTIVLASTKNKEYTPPKLSSLEHFLADAEEF